MHRSDSRRQKGNCETWAVPITRTYNLNRHIKENHKEKHLSAVVVEALLDKDLTNHRVCVVLKSMTLYNVAPRTGKNFVW
jgi:hypothetical protein